MLMGLGAVVLLQGLRGPYNGAAHANASTDQDNDVPSRPSLISHLIPIIVVSASLVAFGLSIERLGLVVAILLLVGIGSLAARLETLARDEISLHKIKSFLRNRKKAFLWDRYKVVAIIVFTILICLLIYFTSR